MSPLRVEYEVKDPHSVCVEVSPCYIEGARGTLIIINAKGEVHISNGTREDVYISYDPTRSIGHVIIQDRGITMTESNTVYANPITFEKEVKKGETVDISRPDRYLLEITNT